MEFNLDSIGRILVLVTTFVFMYLIFRLKKQLELSKRSLEYWEYSSEAKDFLLARAELQDLVPTVRFSINQNTFGILLVYSNPGEEPIKIQCIRGEDGNIHEVPLK